MCTGLWVYTHDDIGHISIDHIITRWNGIFSDQKASAIESIGGTLGLETRTLLCKNFIDCVKIILHGPENTQNGL